MKNTYFRPLIYICIIIVIATTIIRPKPAYALCPDTAAKIQEIFSKILFSDPSTALKLHNIILDIMTACDGANPVAVPTTDPNATPYPTISAIPTEDSAFADLVVQAVQQYCGTVYISKYNIGCLDGLTSLVGQRAIDKLKQYINTLVYLQCVICARGMAEARGRPYEGTGDAKAHAYQTVPGYTYIPNTQANLVNLIPGSLFIVTEGAFGHIGYVTKVYKDEVGAPYAFQAFECNWGGNGRVRSDRVVFISTITGWQRPN